MPENFPANEGGDLRRRKCLNLFSFPATRRLSCEIPCCFFFAAKYRKVCRSRFHGGTEAAAATLGEKRRKSVKLSGKGSEGEKKIWLRPRLLLREPCWQFRFAVCPPAAEGKKLFLVFVPESDALFWSTKKYQEGNSRKWLKSRFQK